MYPAAPRIPHGSEPVRVRRVTYAGIGAGVALPVELGVGLAVGLAVTRAAPVPDGGSDPPPQATSRRVPNPKIPACRSRMLHKYITRELSWKGYGITTW